MKLSEIEGFVDNLGKRYKKNRKALYMTLGCCIVASILGFSLVIPVFDRKSLISHLQTYLEGDIDKNIVDVGENLSEPEAYNYWYAPENSFGISETKTVNWSWFKSLFLNHTDWMLEYKRYEYSDWTNGDQYMTINRTWNDTGFWKFNLIFDVPVDVYSARFTFGCNLSVLDYVERSGYEVWLNYSANQTEVYSIMFNWSDIASIPNLIITKGVQDGMFWFRFRRDDIPAGHYEFDPKFGSETGASSGNSLINYILGSTASPASDGTADNITANIFTNLISGTVNIKCTLYDVSDGTLIGTTEQRSIADNDAYTWEVFAFSEPKPSVSSGTTYIIVAWSGTALFTCNLGSIGSDGKKVAYKNVAYDGFPNPLSGYSNLSNELASIYCSYTEGAANAAPTASGQYPGNGTTNVPLQPTVATIVNDTDTGETINVTWQSNYTGSYVTYQNNLSVASNTNVSWYFDYANTGSTEYWWLIWLHDGTDNESYWYHFTTASNLSWQSLPTMLCNFSLGNTSISRTWNSLHSMTCNFSLGNTSIPRTWNTLPSLLCNFSLGNTSIPRSWNTLSEMLCNFSFGNTSIPRTWQVLSGMLCNFSFGNTSIPRIWNTLSTMFCNFSLGNTSIPRSWNSLSLMLCNFSLGNTSIPRTWQTLPSVLCNFSLGNTTIPHTWNAVPSMRCNFSLGNTTTKDWNVLSLMLCNFSLGNTSIPRTWQELPGLLCNFSLGNTTVNWIIISNIYPVNASTNIPINVTMHITVEHSNGTVVNISWYYGNSSANCTHYLGSQNSTGNGTYYMAHPYANNYTTIYWWKYIVDDGEGQTETEAYYYNSTAGTAILRNYTLNYLSLLLLGIIPLFMLRRKKRKKKGKNVYKTLE